MGGQPAIRTKPPWSFRLATYLNRRGLRGGYRLLDTAAALGWLDGLVRYELSRDVAILVPLARRENRWTREDVESYEWRPVALFCERLAALDAPVRLVDCGADIGLFSARVAARVPGLIEVLAFEPNPEAFEVLERNVALFGRPARARRAALGSFSGRGVLQSPERDRSAHAWFVVQAPAGSGDFDVLRIDDLALPREAALGLKIDVEGDELEVLRGARSTLSEVPHFVLAFEAHREVCRRTGLDPCEALRWLAGMRPVDFVVSERRDLALDAARPFFEQVDAPPICNLIAWTRQPGPSGSPSFIQTTSSTLQTARNERL
jgi:FkbM family methyltransferase